MLMVMEEGFRAAGDRRPALSSRGISRLVASSRPGNRVKLSSPSMLISLAINRHTVTEFTLI